MDATPHSSRFPHNLPPRWRERLEPEASKPYFAKLSGFLRSEIKAGRRVFPTQDRILRALQSVDYEAVKVVILGQDPYHGAEQAVGLCFAVPNRLRPKPPSLKNIFKEIESDLGKAVDPNQSELTHWVEQGVLLLNTVLTVRIGEANSHREQGWETFTDRVIQTLNDREDPVIFILWGSPARKKRALITNSRHPILESPHPSPLSAYHGFFGSRPFSKANALLKKMGKAPVDWEVTA